MVYSHTDVADVRKKTVLPYDIFIHIMTIINLLKKINPFYSFTKSQKSIIQHPLLLDNSLFLKFQCNTINLILMK